jgi:hypothetical protein
MTFMNYRIKTVKFNQLFNSASLLIRCVSAKLDSNWHIINLLSLVDQMCASVDRTFQQNVNEP